MSKTILERRPRRLAVHGRWMATVLGLVLCGGTLPLASCHGPRSDQQARNLVPPAATREASFRVDGMTCASCSVTVKVAAERLPGIVAVRVSREEKRARVTFDPTRTTPQAIAAAISETGYPATPE